MAGLVFRELMETIDIAQIWDQKSLKRFNSSHTSQVCIQTAQMAERELMETIGIAQDWDQTSLKGSKSMYPRKAVGQYRWLQDGNS